MAVIQSLCKRGILLEEGAVAVDAPIEEAVSAGLAGWWSRMLPSISASARTGAAGTRCG